MFHSNYKKNLAIVAAVATFFGFIGAITTFLIFQTITSIPLLGIFSPFSIGRGNQPIIFEQPRELTVSLDTAVTNVLRGSSEQIAYIYPERKNKLNNQPFFNPSDVIGQAVSVTSDGWFLTSSNVVNEQEKDVVVDIIKSENRIGYSIDKVVLDNNSDLVFFKVTPDINLPITRFRSTDDLVLGETVIIRSGIHSLYVGTISMFDDEKNIEKITENPFSIFSISFVGEGPGISSHAVVYDLAGRVIGMTDSKGNMFSTDWENSLDQVLRGAFIKRPYLGLTYLHIDDLIGLSKDELPPVNHGAWIRDLPGTNAFAIDSPLLNTDISEGDVILSVQNEPITKDKTLTDLISQYKPQDVITLEVISDESKIKEITIQLTSY